MPLVAPAGLAWYDGALFPALRGSLFVANLKERSVRRVPIAGAGAAVVPGTQEVVFQELDERLRDVRAGPDEVLYLLTDKAEGRVLRVLPTCGVRATAGSGLSALSGTLSADTARG